MSLLNEEHCDAFSLGVWHMTESETELERLSGCKAPDHLTSPARKREYLAIRALAVAMGIKPGRIGYLPSGKPFLIEDERSISLSHTKNYAALLVASDPRIGIDIEQRTERVNRVRHKFMHPSEEEALSAGSLDETTGLLMHWCAKEAVFKAVPEENIDFAHEIRITRLPIPFSQEGEVCFLRTGSCFQLEVRTTDDFVMAICHSAFTGHPVSE